MHTPASAHAKMGSLEVICGPMFSGKSEELIRRLRRAKIAQQTVCVFKPIIDNRYAIEQIVSHDGNSFEAIATDNIAHIYEHARAKEVDVVGFDEIQFFDKNIISVICDLVNLDKRVIVAGLDLDFRCIPFGPMPTLLAIADTITKLKAICTECGCDAHLSQRLVNGIPARYSDPIILVGQHEAYQARCRGCYTIDHRPEFL